MTASYLSSIESFVDAYQWVINPGLTLRNSLYRSSESELVQDDLLSELIVRVGALAEPLFHAYGVIANALLAIVLIPACLESRVAVGVGFSSFASVGNVIESLFELPSKIRHGCAYVAGEPFFPRVFHSLEQWRL